MLKRRDNDSSGEKNMHIQQKVANGYRNSSHRQVRKLRIAIVIARLRSTRPLPCDDMLRLFFVVDHPLIKSVLEFILRCCGFR
jgi:hypothetical protein